MAEDSPRVIIYTAEDIRKAYFKGVQDTCRMRYINVISNHTICKMWDQSKAALMNGVEIVATVTGLKSSPREPHSIPKGT